MYLTAQRVISPSGENGINGFLYEHGTVAWETPPDPASESAGKLVHSFITVPPGSNRVVSFVDVVAPDDTPYERIGERIASWIAARVIDRRPLPWTDVVEDMRFGLNMTATYARAWKLEVAALIAACRMTHERRELSAAEEPQP